MHSDDTIVEFVERYADRTEADIRRLRASIDDGEIVAFRDIRVLCQRRMKGSMRRRTRNDSVGPSLFTQGHPRRRADGFIAAIESGDTRDQRNQRSIQQVPAIDGGLMYRLSVCPSAPAETRQIRHHAPHCRSAGIGLASGDLPGRGRR